MSEKDFTRARQLEDVAAVLKNPAGLRLLKRMLLLSGALGTVYAPGDPYATAFNEGLRHMGLLILAETREALPEALAGLVAADDPPGDERWKQ